MPNAVAYINMAHILVSYSIDEVLPMNVIEAMYCEKPIVAAQVGALTEIVAHAVNGYLHAPNDAQACFDYLDKLISDPPLRQRIAAAGKKSFIHDERIQYMPLLAIGDIITTDLDTTWSVFVKTEAGHTLKLKSPANRYYADPFLTTYAEETYVFFEDYDKTKKEAHI